MNNILVGIHFIIVTMRWTGLAPWDFEFPFLGSLTSTFPPDTQNVQQDEDFETSKTLFQEWLHAFEDQQEHFSKPETRSPEP